VNDERVGVYGLALERVLRAAARAERLEQALRRIANLNPDLTEDGYDRDELCRYANVVEALALTGLADQNERSRREA
jgi:hypothetical protein